MPSFRGLRRIVRVRFGRRAIDRDIDAEISFHIDARTAALRQAGWEEHDARAAAMQEFGDIAGARDDLSAIDRRAARRSAWLDWCFDLRRDVLGGVRGARRRPALAAAVVLTLAIGIGVTSAVFSVSHAALLAPLPYRDADRLVHVFETRADGQRDESSYPDLLDFGTGVPAFESTAGYDPTNVTVEFATTSEMVRGGRVTAGLFPLLGVQAALGRAFAAEEDAPGVMPVVLVSDGFWRRRMGSDPHAAGGTLQIDGVPHTIIGVLPAGFFFAPIGTADVWLPMGRSIETRANRANRWVNVVARLRPAASIAQANRELAGLMRRLAAEYPASGAGRSAVAVDLRVVSVGSVRPLLRLLVIAGGLVLIIACVNVASLAVAHVLSRRRELAVRAALGASRGRLVRQLVTESVVLSTVAGGLGAWLGIVGVHLLIEAIPDGVRSGLPFWAVAHLRTTVIYATGATGLAIVAFGLVPALGAAGISLGSVLRTSGRGVVGGRLHVRHALVVAEVAATVVLLVGAGLLVRSLRELLRVDAGFDPSAVVTARVALSGPRYATFASRRRFFDDVLARVRADPAAPSVGAISSLPFGGGGAQPFEVVGLPPATGTDAWRAATRVVAGEYFEVLRIGRIAGRGFTPRDDSSARPVVLINQTLRRLVFGQATGIGAHLRVSGTGGREWEVVGVIADVKTGQLDAPAPPTIYFWQPQVAENRLSVVARVRCAAAAPDACPGVSVAAIRRAVAAVDPAVAVYAAGSMTMQLADSPAVFSRRYPLLLVTLFAVTAVVLSLVGLYGMMAHGVAQRMRELGVRMALGASPASVRRAVVGRGLAVTVTGVGIGIPAAVALGRGMRSLLFGVSAVDPVVYASASALLVLSGLAASWGPARRATRVSLATVLGADE